MPAHPVPDAALNADIAILGKKGRGKTYTAKGLVERLLALGRRVLVLDPLSVWWGLRSDVGGTGPGFPVLVLGGPHGDLPLSEGMGRPLARLVARGDLSAVVDMGEMRKAAWQRLVLDLLDELWTSNRDPLWIVLEEADVFAPQNPSPGDSAAVLGEVDRIARRGRAFGFHLISITQRPARLHKDVLTQLSTLIILGMSGPQDRDAMKAWVEGNADRDQARAVMDSLAALPVGEGWVWAPDHDLLERVRFPPITTLDTSATPRAGEARREPGALAAVDLDAVRKVLAEAMQAEEQPAPAKARLPSAEVLAQAEARGYARGLADGERRGRSAERARLRHKIEQALAEEGPEGEQEVSKATSISAKRVKPTVYPPTAPERRGGRLGEADHPSAAPRPVQTPMEAATHSVDDEPATLPSAARKLLRVLDTNPPLAMTWARAATLARLKPRGGSWNTGVKALRERQLVLEEGGLVRIAKPSAAAGAPPGLAAYRAALGGRPSDILGILARNAQATREAIAAELGVAPRGGSWNTAWKALRDNGLIVEEDGLVRLAQGLLAA